MVFRQGPCESIDVSCGHSEQYRISVKDMTHDPQMLPIGIQDSETIRSEDSCRVDRTSLARQIVDEGRRLSRPAASAGVCSPIQSVPCLRVMKTCSGVLPSIPTGADASPIRSCTPAWAERNRLEVRAEPAVIMWHAGPVILFLKSAFSEHAAWQSGWSAPLRQSCPFILPGNPCSGRNQGEGSGSGCPCSPVRLRCSTGSLCRT